MAHVLPVWLHPVLLGILLDPYSTLVFYNLHIWFFCYQNFYSVCCDLLLIYSVHDIYCMSREFLLTQIKRVRLSYALLIVKPSEANCGFVIPAK